MSCSRSVLDRDCHKGLQCEPRTESKISPCSYAHSDIEGKRTAMGTLVAHLPLCNVVTLFLVPTQIFTASGSFPKHPRITTISPIDSRPFHLLLLTHPKPALLSDPSKPILETSQAPANHPPHPLPLLDHLDTGPIHCRSEIGGNILRGPPDRLSIVTGGIFSSASYLEWTHRMSPRSR